MSICVKLNNGGFLIEDTALLPPNCTYELLTPTDISNIKSAANLSLVDLTALLQQFFGFDSALFSLILVSCLSLFVTGFTVGVVWRTLAKTF